LKRLRNITENPEVAVTVDRWDETGAGSPGSCARRAEILNDGEEHDLAQARLRERYPQYRPWTRQAAGDRHADCSRDRLGRSGRLSQIIGEPTERMDQRNVEKPMRGWRQACDRHGGGSALVAPRHYGSRRRLRGRYLDIDLPGARPPLSLDSPAWAYRTTSPIGIGGTIRAAFERERRSRRLAGQCRGWDRMMSF